MVSCRWSILSSWSPTLREVPGQCSAGQNLEFRKALATNNAAPRGPGSPSMHCWKQDHAGRQGQTCGVRTKPFDLKRPGKGTRGCNLQGSRWCLYPAEQESPHKHYGLEAR